MKRLNTGSWAPGLSRSLGIDGFLKTELSSSKLPKNYLLDSKSD